MWATYVSNRYARRCNSRYLVGYIVYQTEKVHTREKISTVVWGNPCQDTQTTRINARYFPSAHISSICSILGGGGLFHDRRVLSYLPKPIYCACAGILLTQVSSIAGRYPGLRACSGTYLAIVWEKIMEKVQLVPNDRDRHRHGNWPQGTESNREEEAEAGVGYDREPKKKI